ncbi:MAG TPA: RNA polymerase sigma factor [Polyangiaceae bacterium]
MVSNAESADLSFEGVYREHFSFVWRSLRRLGVRESDIADTVQETFLIVHRRLAEFEGRAKLTTWLFRIALRVASDYSKRAHVRREVFDDSGFAELSDPTADVEANRAGRDDVRLLETALAALSLEQRAAFVLFELEGLSTTEISERLALPLGTVYSRLRKARALFEKAVSRERRSEAPFAARRIYDGT